MHETQAVAGSHRSGDAVVFLENVNVGQKLEIVVAQGNTLAEGAVLVVAGDDELATTIDELAGAVGQRLKQLDPGLSAFLDPEELRVQALLDKPFTLRELREFLREPGYEIGWPDERDELGDLDYLALTREAGVIRQLLLDDPRADVAVFGAPHGGRTGIVHAAVTASGLDVLPVDLPAGRLGTSVRQRLASRIELAGDSDLVVLLWGLVPDARVHRFAEARRLRDNVPDDARVRLVFVSDEPEDEDLAERWDTQSAIPVTISPNRHLLLAAAEARGIATTEERCDVVAAGAAGDLLLALRLLDESRDLADWELTGTMLDLPVTGDLSQREEDFRRQAQLLAAMSILHVRLPRGLVSDLEDVDLHELGVTRRGNDLFIQGYPMERSVLLAATGEPRTTQALPRNARLDPLWDRIERLIVKVVGGALDRGLSGDERYEKLVPFIYRGAAARQGQVATQLVRATAGRLPGYARRAEPRDVVAIFRSVGRLLGRDLRVELATAVAQRFGGDINVEGGVAEIAYLLDSINDVPPDDPQLRTIERALRTDLGALVAEAEPQDNLRLLRELAASRFHGIAPTLRLEQLLACVRVDRAAHLRAVLRILKVVRLVRAAEPEGISAGSEDLMVELLDVDTLQPLLGSDPASAEGLEMRTLHLLIRKIAGQQTLEAATRHTSIGRELICDCATASLPALRAAVADLAEMSSYKDARDLTRTLDFRTACRTQLVTVPTVEAMRFLRGLEATDRTAVFEIFYDRSGDLAHARPGLAQDLARRAKANGAQPVQAGGVLEVLTKVEERWYQELQDSAAREFAEALGHEFISTVLLTHNSRLVMHSLAASLVRAGPSYLPALQEEIVERVVSEINHQGVHRSDLGLPIALAAPTIFGASLLDRFGDIEDDVVLQRMFEADDDAIVMNAHRLCHALRPALCRDWVAGVEDGWAGQVSRRTTRPDRVVRVLVVAAETHRLAGLGDASEFLGRLLPSDFSWAEQIRTCNVRGALAHTLRDLGRVLPEAGRAALRDERLGVTGLIDQLRLLVSSPQELSEALQAVTAIDPVQAAQITQGLREDERIMGGLAGMVGQQSDGNRRINVVGSLASVGLLPDDIDVGDEVRRAAAIADGAPNPHVVGAALKAIIGLTSHHEAGRHATEDLLASTLRRFRQSSVRAVPEYLRLLRTLSAIGAHGRVHTFLESLFGRHEPHQLELLTTGQAATIVRLMTRHDTGQLARFWPEVQGYLNARLQERYVPRPIAHWRGLFEIAFECYLHGRRLDAPEALDPGLLDTWKVVGGWEMAATLALLDGGQAWVAAGLEPFASLLEKEKDDGFTALHRGGALAVVTACANRQDDLLPDTAHPDPDRSARAAAAWGRLVARSSRRDRTAMSRLLRLQPLDAKFVADPLGKALVDVDEIADLLADHDQPG